MIQPYTHQTSVTRRKYYIDKDVQKWVDQKMLKNPMKTKGLLQYIKGPKFKKWVVQKMKGLKKKTNYIKWKP